MNQESFIGVVEALANVARAVRQLRAVGTVPNARDCVRLTVYVDGSGKTTYELPGQTDQPELICQWDTLQGLRGLLSAMSVAPGPILRGRATFRPEPR